MLALFWLVMVARSKNCPINKFRINSRNQTINFIDIIVYLCIINEATMNWLPKEDTLWKH